MFSFSRIIIRIRAPVNGTRKLVAERPLNLGVVRKNVAKALKPFVSSNANGFDAEVWINGYGKFKETKIFRSEGVTDVSTLASQWCWGET